MKNIFILTSFALLFFGCSNTDYGSYVSPADLQQYKLGDDGQAARVLGTLHIESQTTGNLYQFDKYKNDFMVKVDMSKMSQEGRMHVVDNWHVHSVIVQGHLTFPIVDGYWTRTLVADEITYVGNPYSFLSGASNMPPRSQ